MPNLSDTVSITIGGEELSGFESVQIHTSLETLSGMFELTVSDNVEGKGFKLKNQESCIIKIGSDVVLTGYIFRVKPKIGKDSHSVVIRGRDRVSDLVDCSIATPPLEYGKNTDLFQMVKKWVAPFNPVNDASRFQVLKDYDIEPKFANKFIVTVGETVADALIRACKLKGVLPITDALGRLVLTSSGANKSDDKIQWGVNLKEGEADYDFSNRHSQYTFRAQAPGAGDPISEIWGKTLDLSGTVYDKEVRRFRPAVMHAEHVVTREDCKKRANVEALNRAASSEEATIILQGWRQSTGKLWSKNLIIPCDIPPLYINQEMLSSEVTYILNEEGSETHIKLVRPDAFNPGTKFKISKSVAVGSSTGEIKRQNGLGLF